MEPESILVKGAREHNLKGVSLDIPKKKLVVFTGVSGCGKSSLAFDTLYAEGQRRYVESLSRLRAAVPRADGEAASTTRSAGSRPPSPSSRRRPRNNPRSTVGTVTEVHDYLRVLYASHRRAALPQLRPQGGQAERAADRRRDPQAARRARRCSCSRRWCRTARASTRTCSPTRRSAASPARASTARCSGLEEKIELDKKSKHDIELVIDRLVLKPDAARRG